MVRKIIAIQCLYKYYCTWSSKTTPVPVIFSLFIVSNKWDQIKVLTGYCQQAYRSVYDREMVQPRVTFDRVV